MKCNVIAVAAAVMLIAARGQAAVREPPSPDVLSAAAWKKVDSGVDRGLAWLASQQRPDGSLPTAPTGQPAITSLGVMAFLSRGHAPGEGPYGTVIDRAIDYVLAQQREDGLLYSLPTEMAATDWGQGAHTSMYNHAISGLMLGEAYGMTDERRAAKLRPAIEKAVAFARQLQRRPSPYAKDKYGWRYYRHHEVPNKGEADLSVTGWFVMFYRSAKNAEFDIPQEHVEEAIRFVRQCYRDEDGTFVYGAYGADVRTNRAMTGAGLLCMTIAGHYEDHMAEAAGRWLLAQSFTEYNTSTFNHDRYHYSAYYCSQAMFMMGGDYWRKFYPDLSGALIANQTSSGKWPACSSDPWLGSCYTTTLAILALTPPYQLLPIYQR